MKVIIRNLSSLKVSRTKSIASDKALGVAMLKTELYSEELSIYESLQFISVREIITSKSIQKIDIKKKR